MLVLLLLLLNLREGSASPSETQRQSLQDELGQVAQMLEHLKSGVGLQTPKAAWSPQMIGLSDRQASGSRAQWQQPPMDGQSDFRAALLSSTLSQSPAMHAEAMRLLQLQDQMPEGFSPSFTVDPASWVQARVPPPQPVARRVQSPWAAVQQMQQLPSAWADPPLSQLQQQPVAQLQTLQQPVSQLMQMPQQTFLSPIQDATPRFVDAQRGAEKTSLLGRFFEVWANFFG